MTVNILLISDTDGKYHAALTAQGAGPAPTAVYNSWDDLTSKFEEKLGFRKGKLEDLRKDLLGPSRTADSGPFESTIENLRACGFQIP